MGYAEVCVNSPVARRLAFSYSIPASLSVQAGQAVWVPFGAKVLQGIVLELTDKPAVEETRDIGGIIEPRPLLSPAQVKLARWLSDYYLSPLFDAVALMLPPGFERKVVTFLSASPGLPETSLSPVQKDVLELIRRQGRVSLSELEKALGQRKARAAVSPLVARGLVLREYEMGPVRVKPRSELYLSLSVDPDRARQEAAALRKRAPRQAALLELLIEENGPVAFGKAREKAGPARTATEALVRRGLIAIRPVEVKRDPLSDFDVKPSGPLTPTPAQSFAIEQIRSALLKQNEPPAIFLLHGVTGSGKTEVYLQALAETVRLGKRGIVLVPEIALTPQAIERFASRFPGRVAVLHSGLSLGEQFDEWRRIRDGEFDVVIGSRSAIFAPQPDLGLIVVDEEHEWTYKQADQSPRYHARTVSLKLAELTGAVAVLGSATPDVETFYHARHGRYRLLELPGRVTPGESLPGVSVVDLREELKAGNRSMFSRALYEAINAAIDSGGQVILFLNRRGSASHVQCRACGFVLRCRRCDIALTYHLAKDRLICHQCNYRAPTPHACPRCRSRRIKYLGVGTQKLELEAGSVFPRARLLRWDSDTSRTMDSHREILNRFRDRQADILIGTQMIAKGLDFPTVTLVGVVSADTGLNLPDFRAGERTFQLLSQVAGRAGRGIMGGQVIVQTYYPEHYAVQAVVRHDYASFYEQEIEYRRQLRTPPFTRLASLTYSHTNEHKCQWEAESMKRLLLAEIESRGLDDISLVGPAPAFSYRLRGRYHWQIVLRGSGLPEFLAEIPSPKGWVVDIDPVGV